MDRLVRCLELRAQLSEQLCVAVEQRDPRSAMRIASELDVTTQEVGRSMGWIRTLPSAEAAQVHRTLAPLLGRVASADARRRTALQGSGVSTLQDWLARQAVDEVPIADELLSEPWDMARDLLVLAGPPQSTLVAQLLARGQRRIFCLWADALPFNTPEQAVVRAFPSIQALDAACWELAWPPPRQVRLATVGGSFPVPPDQLGANLQQTLTTMSAFSGALELYGRAFLSASARNLAAVAVHPSVSALAGALAGTPAIIASAGPSLDKNLHLLKDLGGRAVVIAISQTLPALRKAGLLPDIALAVDPLNLSYHFEGLSPGELPVLGVSAGVFPGLFDIPAERLFTMAASPVTERWIFELFGEDASVPCGGTVAHTALQLALKLGCDPIIVIGQDFALDGRKYYAEGSADGGHLLEVDGEGLSTRGLPNRETLARGAEALYQALLVNHRLAVTRVKGWHGSEVVTTVDLQQHINAYRSMLLAAKGKARFINATEGGAYLDGMEHLPLAQVMEALPARQRDIRTALRQALTLEDAAARKLKMQAELKVLAERLKRVAWLADRCARDLQRGRPNGKHTPEFRRLADSIPFLGTWALREVRQMLECGESEVTDAARLDGAELALYRSTIEAAQTFGPMLDEAIRKL